MTRNQFIKGKIKSASNYYCLFLFAGFILAFTAVLPQKATAQQTAGADKKWLGSFMFDDAANTSKRRIFTDVAPSASYDINIEQGANGKLTAIFNANGMQLFESYECAVKTSGDKSEFYYEKFVADGAEDLRKFKRGALLFSLVKTQVGKQTKYLFEPAGYKILRFDKTKQSQLIYFTKQ